MTQLDSIGPYLAGVVADWLKTPPKLEMSGTPHAEFLTHAQAADVLSKHPTWVKMVRGDLQMHTQWSDGSGTILDMARQGAKRGYTYISITDHTKDLKIANGLDECRLARQAKEIAGVNDTLGEEGIKLTVLRSAEVNLSPLGQVDMEPS
ncbi:hypothetical protein [Brevifollis gellanilyticus]|uniref:Polymerase/histidinol phosphatase N-terminal domain-containing protein n=1 Tax=Brevifollis gellanilyticus TaxID=748831 RepID=A0A512MAW1_9BACT|nr:hypothetical protein [Brevifollis gellanilyticus]GEP43877.1 hypothetical protein BGE01nite_31680 [Brevifollis gellanilyticus]